MGHREQEKSQHLLLQDAVVKVSTGTGLIDRPEGVKCPKAAAAGLPERP